MSRRHYFLLASLPPLPELGEVAPVALRDFRELVGQVPSALPVIEASLLEQDLLRREAALAGEIEPAEPLVLTAGQVGGTEPLPEFLAGEPDRPRRVAADAMWEAYYRYAHRLARAQRCDFLRRWVEFEVALRNALAAARARALDLDEREYLLAEEIADADAPVEEIVSAWSAAEDPLSAMRALDQHRWAWLAEHARYFSFELDELAAYARRLVLITRWHVLTREPARVHQAT